jgi:hypothetical protein
MSKDRMREEEPLPSDLQALFASYRAELPDPEPSANFMPAVWAKIEPQRSLTYSFRRIAKALVTAAVGACLLMSAFMATVNHGQPVNSAYVDVLDSNDDSPDANELL